MKILIVINRNPQRSNYLAELVGASEESFDVSHLMRGVDLVSGRLEASLAASGPFDLILYHCGGTNAEYSAFVEAFLNLCKTKRWRQPGIILFSGDPAAVTVASIKYSSNVAICVASQRDLEANLQQFLRVWVQTKSVELDGDTSTALPCEILEGCSEMEIALQALSALLPFGIVWATEELSGKDTGLSEVAKALAINLFSGLERVMVERFTAHLHGQSGQRWVAKNQKEILVVDSLLVRASTNPTLVEQWKEEDSGAEAAPANLDGALKVLADSNTLDQWNARLKAFRDSILTPQ